MKIPLRGTGETREVHVEREDERVAHVRVGDLEARFTVEPLGSGCFRLSDGARTWKARVDRRGATRWVTVEGAGEGRFERERSGRRRRREEAKGSHASPMPGTVVKVLVAAGDVVGPGQDLLVIEAMKMEIKASAQLAGRVGALRVAEGDPCDAGEILVEIEPSGPPGGGRPDTRDDSGEPA